MKNKKYLLDTHVLLWWLAGDSRLRSKMHIIVSNPENYICVSATSSWEVTIKLMLNKGFKMQTSVSECFKMAGFPIIPITFEHTLMLEKLPLLHSDPFDRILISQALVEECVLLSTDEKIKQYSEQIVEFEVIS